MCSRWMVIAAAMVVQASGLAKAAPRVEIEVLTKPGLNATTSSQQWMKTLANAGFSNAQFRPVQAGDRIEVQATGSGAAATIHVTAQLDEHGMLITPGGQFAVSDSAKLKKWVEDLQSGGAEGVGQPR